MKLVMHKVLGHQSGEDLAVGTGFQPLVRNFGNDNDQC